MHCARRELPLQAPVCALIPETLANYDLALLVTDHAKFDYNMIQEHAKLVVDTRGVYSSAPTTS